jgi:hypothetical protein
LAAMFVFGLLSMGLDRHRRWRREQDTRLRLPRPDSTEPPPGTHAIRR